jgi:hypothetical protein
MNRQPLHFDRFEPSDASWWIDADRPTFTSYVTNESNIRRMSRGKGAKFVSGGEGWNTPSTERRIERVEL